MGGDDRHGLENLVAGVSHGAMSGELSMGRLLHCGRLGDEV